jgi:orotate phosphoribosyltransferase
MRSEDVLGAFEETGALLSGHFELRSGLHSDRYFQCARVLEYPRIAERLCAALAEKLRRGCDELRGDETVMAPALGGIVVGHELARALGGRSIFAEKVDGRLELRRFQVRPGERFVVGEDVVTRGGRVQETVDIVRQAGGDVVAVAVLVNRSGGKASFGVPLFSLMEMEPVTWSPETCPLCKAGDPVTHPGS